MKTLTLITLFLFSLSFSVEAQKCKPALSQKDKFSGEQIEAWGGMLKSLTSLNQFSTGGQGNIYLYVFFMKADDTTYINCQASYHQESKEEHVNSVSASKGNKFKLKTASGITEFEATEIKKKRRTSLSDKVVTTIQFISPVSKEILKIFSSEPIEGILIEPDSNEIRAVANKRKAQKVMKQAECFLKQL